MKAGWRVVPLGEVVERTETVDPTRSPQSSFLYVDVSSVSNESFSITGATEMLGSQAPSRARRRISEGDIIFATIRPTLQRIAQVPSDLHGQVCSTGFIVLRASPRLEPRYLFHYLCSDAFTNAMDTLQTGASYPAVTDSQVRQQPIPLPPLDEQKRIVAVLDEAFEGLSRARANAEANLADARELFSKTITQVLERMSSTAERVRLEEVTRKITKGSSPKWQGVNYVEEPGVLFVTSENVKANRIDLTARKYVEERFNEIESRSILERGDVLTNIVGASIGRAAVYNEDDRANINQAVCLIRCDPKFLLGDYLSFLLNSDALLSALHEGKTEMARANLSLAFFRELPIPLPAIEDQRDIVEALKAVSDEAARLVASIVERCSAIDTLRQSILQKAFSGELT